jgi:TonB family protein
MGTVRKADQTAESQGTHENKLYLHPRRALPPGSDSHRKQRRRMVAAAFLLLLALGVLLIRDRDLWFGRADTDVAEIDTTEAASIEPHHAADKPAQVQLRAKTRKRGPVTVPSGIGAGIESPIVTDRKALPPMEVQVVSDGEPRTLRPNNDSVKVEMQESREPDSSPMLQFAEAAVPPSINASQRVKMSADARKALETPVAPSYPVLARQMKVQGAVAIQALIGASGEIQDLRILSGPSILASAAQEAVRQWRFKPYLQNGQPVETQARITVNFTISTF